MLCLATVCSDLDSLWDRIWLIVNVAVAVAAGLQHTGSTRATVAAAVVAAATPNDRRVNHLSCCDPHASAYILGTPIWVYGNMIAPRVHSTQLGT